MAFGVQTFDASGALLFDTTTAVGFATADFRTYLAGSPGETINYPQFAGFTAYILDCGGSLFAVSLSTSAGYPVVTVNSTTFDKSFALIVY